MNWLRKLFCFHVVKELREENELLRQKLEERQDAINKTNAYWKKKFYNLNRKKTSQ